MEEHLSFRSLWWLSWRRHLMCYFEMIKMTLHFRAGGSWILRVISIHTSHATTPNGYCVSLKSLRVMRTCSVNSPCTCYWTLGKYPCWPLEENSSWKPFQHLHSILCLLDFLASFQSLWRITAPLFSNLNVPCWNTSFTRPLGSFYIRLWFHGMVFPALTCVTGAILVHAGLGSSLSHLYERFLLKYD